MKKKIFTQKLDILGLILLTQALIFFAACNNFANKKSPQYKSYNSAIKYIESNLLKKGVIIFKNQICIDTTFIDIEFGNFISTSYAKSKFEILKFDSSCSFGLKNKFSNYLIKNCNEPKVIIFLSKVCNQKLQINVYPFNPSLNSLDYKTDYYGPYESYLFNLKSNGKIAKVIRTIIHSN